MTYCLTKSKINLFKQLKGQTMALPNEFWDSKQDLFEFILYHMKFYCHCISSEVYMMNELD